MSSLLFHLLTKPVTKLWPLCSPPWLSGLSPPLHSTNMAPVKSPFLLHWDYYAGSSPLSLSPDHSPGCGGRDWDKAWSVFQSQWHLRTSGFKAGFSAWPPASAHPLGPPMPSGSSPANSSWNVHDLLLLAPLHQQLLSPGF